MVNTLIEKFLEGWTKDGSNMKPVFERFLALFAESPGIGLDFKERPGVSYSLRAKHENQKNRNLFVMVDIIDDDPENRWLSVCFYGDMVSDPEEMGDLVPGGLLGEDGYCFDLSDGEDAPYIEERIREAMKAAENS